MFWIYFGIAWGLGWLVHTAIIGYSWWSGRLYWKPQWWCLCSECQPFLCSCNDCVKQRNRPNHSYGVHANREGSPHSVPHMLELSQVIGLTIGGLFAWWGFLIAEAYDFIFNARERHLEYLKKRNRPIEEVLKELNEFIEEGSAETEKQVNEFVEKQKERSNTRETTK